LRRFITHRIIVLLGGIHGETKTCTQRNFVSVDIFMQIKTSHGKRRKQCIENTFEYQNRRKEENMFTWETSKKNSIEITQQTHCYNVQLSC